MRGPDVALERRSDGEMLSETLDWHRRFCKAQRARLTYRLTVMEKRIQAERVARLEDWDGHNRRGGKKPGLDYYDARWR